MSDELAREGDAAGDAFEPASLDSVDLPKKIVTYLRVAEHIAALVPTLSFEEDLARCRRNVAHFAHMLDAAPREALREALESAHLEVDSWWEGAKAADNASPGPAAAAR